MLSQRTAILLGRVYRIEDHSLGSSNLAIKLQTSSETNGPSKKYESFRSSDRIENSVEQKREFFYFASDSA